MVRKIMTAGGRRGVLTVLALTAAVAGAVIVTVAFAAQEPAPPTLDSSVATQAPSPAQTTPPPAQSPSPQPAPAPSGQFDVEPAKTQPLGPSQPVSISIPAIDVRSEVFKIGKAKDGTLRVPQPGPNLDKAAWYKNSATPGQPGPSIIEGHVVTAQSGPSVFFNLAELRPGDEIKVEREDGKTVFFEVDALREFAKDEFPTKLVYGGDLSTPQLRLITCSDFDESVDTHTSNLVVFSHLTRVRAA